MDLQKKRDLQLLNAFEGDPDISQRSLSKKLGVALGLTNLYIKRLVSKGYIKISTIPRNRIKYLLTPRGMAEKSRLTYLYMQYSLTYYQDMRQQLKGILANLSRADAKRIVVYGVGELAELTYLTIREMDLSLIGIIDQNGGGQRFLSYPTWPVGTLSQWDFDAVLITVVDNPEKIRTQILQLGIPSEKVYTL